MQDKSIPSVAFPSTIFCQHARQRMGDYEAVCAAQAEAKRTQFTGVQPDDLSNHTSECLDRSWTVYGQSPLVKHVCVCDGRGDGMTWDALDRERRLVVQQEVEVRQERVAREREKWQVQDAPADFTAGTTLDDLTAVFDDEVDLTPTPAILDRRHGDGGLVLPAGKLNWLYGLPAAGSRL